MNTYKAIPGYSRYLIDERGNIWDNKQHKHLNPIENGGYACVNLHNDSGKKVLEKVHRCVANTFIPKPDNSTNLVLHIDLNRMNNHVSNLRWKVKGKSDTSHVRFHTLNGKKYHKTTLESLAEQCSLTWECVRQRLDAGWTDAELLQGYKDSEVFYVDEMQFIGYHTVKRYREMLDKDVKSKEKYQRVVDNQHQEFLWGLQVQSWKDRRNGLSEGEYEVAVKVWNGIMKRCYDTTTPGYHTYGGSGVTVCDTWKDVGNFVKWWKDNYISGWEVEKDILPFINGTVGKQYSPSNCCFVPKEVNVWFSSRDRTNSINEKQDGSYSMYCGLVRNGVKRKITLCGDTRDEVWEQYCLLKTERANLHYLQMLSDYKSIKQNNPKTPEINSLILSYMQNYEYQNIVPM